MPDGNDTQLCDIGLVGLGVMGLNFALNLADHGHSVAGYNRDPVKMSAVESSETGRHAIHLADDIQALCRRVRRPRSIMMLVPAGGPVDDVIGALTPHLEPGDLIIDSGNSHFSDTDRRSASLKEKGLLFLGMGMSGGESGARHGPSLMPGGSEEGYRRVRPLLESAAAQTDSGTCVAFLGPGSAGHYVKMVHNGIEYGLMQLIAETYDLLKRGLGMSPDDLHGIYRRWNGGALDSYLIEITADIFLQQDPHTGRPLIDLILDEARQKGTGEWTASDALQLQVPTPNIDIAVMMRHMSANRHRHGISTDCFKGPDSTFAGREQAFVDKIEHALFAAVLITYAQGMALLKEASRIRGYRLNLETVARIWTGGCIIRAALLSEIQNAYRNDADLENLLLSPPLSRLVQARLDDLRAVVRTGAALGLPLPGLMMALAYRDAHCSSRLPSNLIMAQRDYFGSHTYERVDRKGTFHTHWRHE